MEYPTKDKLLAIFPLDGNGADTDSNQFESKSILAPRQPTAAISSAELNNAANGVSASA